MFDDPILYLIAISPFLAPAIAAGLGWLHKPKEDNAGNQMSRTMETTTAVMLARPEPIVSGETSKSVELRMRVWGGMN